MPRASRCGDQNGFQPRSSHNQDQPCFVNEPSEEQYVHVFKRIEEDGEYTLLGHCIKHNEVSVVRKCRWGTGSQERQSCFSAGEEKRKPAVDECCRRHAGPFPRSSRSGARSETSTGNCNCLCSPSTAWAGSITMSWGQTKPAAIFPAESNFILELMGHHDGNYGSGWAMGWRSKVSGFFYFLISLFLGFV
jgi:hypothetical protein